MNVLYIIGGEGNRYGSEIIAMNLLESAISNDINYTVIVANKGAVSERCKELGIVCHIIPFRFYVYKRLDNRLLNAVKKIIWRLRADYLTAKAVKRVEKEIDLSTIDVIHTNLSRDLLGSILASNHKIPHVWHIQELFDAHYKLSFLKENQMAWMISNSDVFLAISRSVASDWIKHGIPSDKVRVVYNGIDLNSIDRKTDYSDERLCLVMVGHLCEAKGQELIVKRLGLLPQSIKSSIHLDLFGEGDEVFKRSLINLAKENNVSITLKGYHQSLGKILKNYDIGINCSRGEGFGLSTVEYMAAGLCVVASNTGANCEIITNNDNGFLFDYSDDYSFVSVITDLYKDRNKMHAVAEKASTEVASLYSLDAMCKQVYNIYASLI